MLRVRVYDTTSGALLEGGEELFAAPGVKWVDLVEPDEATLDRLGQHFGLHKLALEDCMHLDQRPKLEDYGAHQFLVLQGFSCPADSLEGLVMHEVHFFMNRDWVITVHDREHDALAEVRKRIAAEPAGTLGRGADFVAYLLADALVDRNFPILDQFNDTLEELEERIFSKTPDPSLMQETFALKRTLVTLRRVLSPQRDVVAMLARPGLPQVQERTTLYFRDVYDHLVRIAEQLDTTRDLVANVVDAYHSRVANRTNDITKQLTIFAALFLPMSFIVGFFGQNFDVLARSEFLWAMLGAMLAVPLTMVWWFKRKGWF